MLDPAGLLGASASLSPAYREIVDLFLAEMPRRLDALGTALERGGRDEAARLVLCADPRSLPFRPGAFEAVVCSSGLPAEPTPVAVLSAWRRLARAGGTLILLSPVREGVAGGAPQHEERG